MPLVHANGLTLHYRFDGADDGPVLMLSHALGLDLGMWDPQAAALAPHVRVLRYDLRGHGASSVPRGDYTIAELGADALALADALGIGTFAFCGQSLGGMVGIWLAANAPDRVTHLVLANTSAKADSQAMDARRRTVLEGGMGPIADVVMTRFFSEAFLAKRPAAVAWARRTVIATSPVGYAACCAAIRDMDQTAVLAGIRVPTLVIGGDHDLSLPWKDHGATLAASIANARAALLPAAHLPCLEVPHTFSAALAGVLVPPPVDRLAAGFTTRRAVLGDAYVDRAVRTATEFTRGFQELVTTYAWGSVWSRPGLDRHTRRLLVLAVTASLGRWEEFRLHLVAGLDDDLEWCDVEEVLLQVAVYAGLPAANTAFHTAVEERSRRARG